MVNNNILKSKKGLSFIDLWGIFYIIMVYSFTLMVNELNIFIFGIYFIFALPFFNHLDKFATICLLLSTMAYYFLGADEGVWSLYTIFSILMVFHIFVKGNINVKLKPCLCFAWMILAVLFSYCNSELGYLKGMFAILYNIVITILVALSIEVNKDTITSFLPRLASIQLVLFILLLLVNGHYDGYGFSISESINHNTFGSSVAILSIILFVKIIFFNGKIVYKLLWGTSFVLAIVVGSRNALLAMILTFVIVYLIMKSNHKKILDGVVKILIGACAVVLMAIFILPKIGIDVSRYNFIELISSGGSNRTIIWKTLTPAIFEKYMWLGYGPSHYCSEQIILSLMNLNYSHTHNTIFEAWGELGFIGLIPFVLILIWSFKKGYFFIKNKSHYLMIGFLFIGLLLLGLGESFFANVELWIIIGLLLGGKNILEEKVSENNNRTGQSNVKK